MERGDRVATLLPSLPETAAVFLGTYKRGAILLSLSVLYGDDGIEHRLRDSQAKAVVTDSANRHRIPEGMVEKVLVMGGRGEADDVDFDETMARASDSYEMADTAADDPAQLYYSSGTTGQGEGHPARPPLPARPRGVRVLPRRARRRALPRVGRVGLGGRASARCWGRGATAPWRWCRRARAATTPRSTCLPVQARGAEHVHHADRAAGDDGVADAGSRYPMGELRVTCSAGEPLNPEVIRWFREQYGITVLDYYGLTESYPLCGNFPTVEVREGSMGRPMPGWEVAILDEDEQPLGVGERGEICLRARSNPHYPLGYWNRPEEDTARGVRRRLVPHQGRRGDGRGRLRLVRRPRRRRDHLGRVPDRAVRGGVRLRGAPGGQGGGGGGVTRRRGAATS